MMGAETNEQVFNDRFTHATGNGAGMMPSSFEGLNQLLSRKSDKQGFPGYMVLPQKRSITPSIQGISHLEAHHFGECDS